MTRIERLFNVLNVSSNPADLLPQARIRLAALELFAQQGFDQTTIRQIATRAGVSPGLVIHHYGSKRLLHDAVDTWVMDVLASEKGMVIAGSVMPRMDSYLDEHPEFRPILDYLIMSVRTGGEIAGRMFDRLCELTDQILDLGEAQGTIRHFDDRTALTAVLVAYSLGLSILGDQVATRLGGNTLLDAEPFRRYSLVTIEMFTTGIFSDPSFVEATKAAFVPSDKESNHE